MKTYIAVYIGAFALAMLVTPRATRLARAMGIMDMPGARRVHKDATPRFGGVALVLATLTMLVIMLTLDNVIGRAFRGVRTELIALVAGSLLIFAIGVLDDIRGLAVSTKLVCQIAAAVLVCALGIRIGSISIAGITLHFGWLAWPLTILWIIGVTNALNLIDGIDGLAAGIALIACGAITVLAIHLGQPVMAVLMLALCGSLTGFLVFNFHPARVFLGDGGSLFLGFIIATGSVMSATKSAALLGLGLPALALSIPILDAAFSVLRRALRRRSIVAPDRGHIHHRLLALGVTQPRAAILIWAVTLAFTGIGLFMFITRGMIPLLVYCCVVAVLMSAFWIAGTVRLREGLAHLRRRLVVNNEAKGHMRRYEEASLHFDEAASFDGWWESVCAAACQMDFTGLRMQWPSHDGSAQTLVWQHPKAKVPADRIAQMRVPVHKQHLGPPAWIQCNVAIGSSLESASRRMMLFSRLLEEYSPADLPSDSKQPSSVEPTKKPTGARIPGDPICAGQGQPKSRHPSGASEPTPQPAERVNVAKAEAPVVRGVRPS